MSRNKSWFWSGLITLALLCLATSVLGSEADIKIPDLANAKFGNTSGMLLLYIGLAVCVLGAGFGVIQYQQTKALPVHKRMSDVSNVIWKRARPTSCSRASFCGAVDSDRHLHDLLLRVLQRETFGRLLMILVCSILGILGSYGVAWFGIRINTVANSRGAFSSLRGNLLNTLNISLRSGMSVGLLLVSVELFFMICILAFLKDLAGPCFIGFAIGESLGASALRICGGIFTKIADIGSDLMKIVFKLPEDDPKNPGVIADCTGTTPGTASGRRRTVLRHTG